MCGDEPAVRFSIVGDRGLYRPDLRVRRDFGRDDGRVGALVGSPICLLQWDLARL